MPALFLDDLHASKIQPASLASYRRACSAFLDWLGREGFAPAGAVEFDDLAVEFRRATRPSKSSFVNLVAGLEFIFPHFRGKLKWAKAVAIGWSISAPVQHTLALPWAGAILLADSLIRLKYPRLGLALLVQQRAGLRPSEVLKLSCNDVQLHGRDPSLPQQHQILLCLGARKGTKAKRRQYAIIVDAGLHELLRRRLAVLQPHDLVINYSYAQYRIRLLEAQRQRRWTIRFTPHSPRAGFVYDQTLLGTPPEQIRIAGRWASEKSFRTYQDIVGASVFSNDFKEDLSRADVLAGSLIRSFGDLNDDAAARQRQAASGHAAAEAGSDSEFDSEDSGVEGGHRDRSGATRGSEGEATHGGGATTRGFGCQRRRR